MTPVGKKRVRAGASIYVLVKVRWQGGTVPVLPSLPAGGRTRTSDCWTGTHSREGNEEQEAAEQQFPLSLPTDGCVVAAHIQAVQRFPTLSPFSALARFASSAESICASLPFSVKTFFLTRSAAARR